MSSLIVYKQHITTISGSISLTSLNQEKQFPTDHSLYLLPSARLLNVTLAISSSIHSRRVRIGADPPILNLPEVRAVLRIYNCL